MISYHSQQRYYPVYLAIFIYTSFKIIYLIIIHPLLITLGVEYSLHIHLNQYNVIYMLSANQFEWNLWIYIKEFILYMFNIPINLYILNHLKNQHEKIQISKLYLVTPIAILGILFTDIYAALLLYSISLLLAIIINKKAKRQKEIGKKML